MANRQWRPSPLRRISPPAIVALFLVVILWLGVSNDYPMGGLSASSFLGQPMSLEEELRVEASRKKLDFSQYVGLWTISGDEIAIDDPERRLIIVGDVHGMDNELGDLLKKVGYSSEHDRLVHLGDVTIKGPHSRRVLSRLASQNVTGVRGNHDQKVIEWRGFIDYVKSQKGGREWFEELEAMDLTPKQFDKLSKKKKKYKIPDGWEWGSEHWNLARKLSESEYNYLRSLPLAIHLPSLHTFVVHAGMLPYDPTHSMRNKKQPLSHLPTVSHASSQDVETVRAAQELTILNEVPQNRKPFTLLNLRDVTPKGKVSRKPGNGQPWADMWNEVQHLCKGFSSELVDDNEPDELKRKKYLPCYPTNVIYGHAAKRGLDLKRWTKGIDTGCVYGRRLTALVFGDTKHKGLDDSGDEEELEEVRFGDSSKARVVSVKCRAP
ncbi:hypothetical protein M407DRAFT_181716 [Tulasnella calospora MUT 4182]|uniref:Calcineurin-like phosphoesterase domain-containing protein n=1 Tax=Tulasnella calospora MUT 4182 TaxID=1051891 RepID=A0A0C3QCE0_9AGAM|nr:hypothetical protein M407DRAFT_181716 [Tulasnella calospora MUT 4182]